MNWNAETIAQLRALWAEGHSAAEIGRRMGTTKSAICGKAHRLDLPARPSPIRAASGPARPPRAGRHTLPAFGASHTPALAVPPGASPHPAKAAAPPEQCSAPAQVNPMRGAAQAAVTAGRAGAGHPGAAVAGTADSLRRAELAAQTRRLEAHRGIDGRIDAMLPKPVAEVQVQRISKPCCWPIGEPRTPGFRFCEAAGIPGKPYCPEHLAVSRPKVREVEAA